MFKSVFLLKRKPGTTMEEFKAYYETSHRKLGEKVLPTAERYFRRYLTPFSPDPGALADEQEFDVITEVWFKDRATFEAAIARLGEPSTAQEIMEDESRFMDRSRIRLFTIEECESVIDGDAESVARSAHSA
jgi:EthD domain